MGKPTSDELKKMEVRIECVRGESADIVHRPSRGSKQCILRWTSPRQKLGDDLDSTTTRYQLHHLQGLVRIHARDKQ